jgi:hypothetical protein
VNNTNYSISGWTALRMAIVESSISIGTIWVVLVILNLVGMTIAAYRILRKK